MSSRKLLSLRDETKTFLSVNTLLSRILTLLGLFITPSLC